MTKEIISEKEGIHLLVLFLTGTTVLFGLGSGANKDAWLAVLLGFIISLPIIIIYARLLSLFPGKDLFDIMEITLGKILGKIVIFLYVLFAMHLGALVTLDFGEFPTITYIRHTPRVVPMLFFIFLICWFCKEGLETLSKCSILFSHIFIILVIFSIPLAMSDFNIYNILPILQNGIKPVLESGFLITSFPFTEAVFFCFLFSAIKVKSSLYNVFLKGSALGGFLIFIITLSLMLHIGPTLYGSLYFPTYFGASLISAGTFLERIEVVVSISFFLGGVVKACICLLVACKGFAKIINAEDYRFIVTPVSLLILILSLVLHPNAIDMLEWDISVWTYYSLPFQVLIPLFIFIIASFKHKRLIKH